MNSKVAPFHPVLLESEPSLMSEPKMQALPLQSRQDGEKVRHQTSTSTSSSIDVSITSKVIMSAKNSNRMLSRLDSLLMCAESLIFPFGGPGKGAYVHALHAGYDAV